MATKTQKSLERLEKEREGVLASIEGLEQESTDLDLLNGGAGLVERLEQIEDQISSRRRVLAAIDEKIQIQRQALDSEAVAARERKLAGIRKRESAAIAEVIKALQAFKGKLDELEAVEIELKNLGGYKRSPIRAELRDGVRLQFDHLRNWHRSLLGMPEPPTPEEAELASAKERVRMLTERLKGVNTQYPKALQRSTAVNRARELAEKDLAIAQRHLAQLTGK